MLLNLALAILTLAYPAIIYFGLEHIEPKFIGLLLLGLVTFRFWRYKDKLTNHWGLLALSLVLSIWAIGNNSGTALHLYPVLINLSLLAIFTASLTRGTPIIEQLARITEPDLPPSGVNYTRKVTIIWSLFFALNGSIAAYTVWLEDPEIWALYNGVVSYLAIGVLFSLEWIIRQVMRAQKRV